MLLLTLGLRVQYSVSFSRIVLHIHLVVDYTS